MDEQAFPVIIMHLALIGIAGNGRELCQKVHAFDQGLVYINIVRVVIVIIQGKDRVLEAYSSDSYREGAAGSFPRTHPEWCSSVSPHCRTFPVQLSWQISEQQEETGFLIPEMALLLPLYQVQYIHAPVEKAVREWP